VLRRVELHGRTRKERRRAVPAPSAVFRYLGAFHDPEEEAKRVQGKAFIPAPAQALKALYRVNQELVAFKQARAPQKTATMDLDATLIETHKRLALFCYQGYAPSSAADGVLARACSCGAFGVSRRQRAGGL
jgi:hypothetical protein